VNAAIFSPEDGDSIFLRNAGIYPGVYMTLQRQKINIIFTAVRT
jgi:hypothetical protein